MGRIVSTQDALGNRTHTTFDVEGRLTSYSDELGQRTTLTRDASGNVTSLVAPGGHRWVMKHDNNGFITERTDPLGITWSCAYDKQGRTIKRSGPSGDEVMSYDAHGNLAQFTNALGSTWKYTHDLLGRIVAVEGPEGHRYTMEYDAYGRLVCARGPCGQRMDRDHDAASNVVAERASDGAVVQYRHLGPALVEQRLADGGVIRSGYDALLRRRWTENPAGERSLVDYDAGGRIVRERTFAGHEYRYEHDDAKRWKTKVWPDGQWQRFVRDPAGRVVAVERSDGRTDHFERDERGFVVRASNQDVSVTLVRDAFGRVTREVQSAVGWEFGVEHRADPQDVNEIHRYSTGWSVTLQRGPFHVVQEIAVDEGQDCPSEAIVFERDERRREVRRVRKGRADGITTRRDPMGRPVEVDLIDARGKVLRKRTYRWAAAPGLAAMTDSELGERIYALDPLGRPLRARGAHVDEAFRYSPHGTPLPEREEGSVGAGGRRLSAGDTRFVWDARGRLHQTVAAEPARSWTFTYDTDNRLREALRGDGYRARFVYDPFGRRIAIAGSDGSSTWFGWDASAPVEERSSNGAVVRRVFDDDEHTPLLESVGPGAWRMVATDATGTPFFFLGRDGAHGEIELSTWGRVAFARGETGALRFAGQRADAETGLVYNRHRYYLPEIGQYITPDPLGEYVSFQDIGFVPNPTAYIDPFGLIIIVGMQRQGMDPEADAAAEARARTTNPAQRVVYMNDLYNPNNKEHQKPANAGRVGRLDNLPPGEGVEVIAHGAPGVVRFGRDVVGGADVAKRLQHAGLKPGTPVTVVACHSATTPANGGQSVVNALHQATGGQNPVTGVAANAGSTNPRAGIAVTRPGVPGARPHADGPTGTVDITDGHWARAEGGKPAAPIDPPPTMGDPSGPAFTPPEGG
ncbi:RHS repeat-associated core domain-containing protein [Sorangium sp. So ce321]|uniref:RHS repeat-associated core domain-containing protein n=1 Tax=Sorangium sp. So ce321 TaxID=3133300 RepID=UPI003F60A6B1